MQLVRYEAARQALQAAVRVNEVKDIRDKAQALAAYARQAKDTALVEWATEIKVRAERRGGEMTRDIPTRQGETTSPYDAEKSKAQILSEIGVTTQQASRWERLAAISEDKFEQAVAVAKETAREVTTAALLRATKKDRQTTKVTPKPAVGEYAVILADPPWRYDFAPTSTRQIENQYPTLDVADICALAVPAAKDSVIFMWATAPKLLEALEVLKAWNFSYVTHAIWDKEIIGMGYWFRGQHELLLVGVRGKFPPPAEQHRISSVIREKRGRHSEKPAAVHKLIEAAYPDSPKLEMFARKKRDGWEVWGNEA